MFYNCIPVVAFSPGAEVRVAKQCTTQPPTKTGSRGALTWWWTGLEGGPENLLLPSITFCSHLPYINLQYSSTSSSSSSTISLGHRLPSTVHLLATTSPPPLIGHSPLYVFPSSSSRSPPPWTTTWGPVCEVDMVCVCVFVCVIVV